MSQQEINLLPLILPSQGRVYSLNLSWTTYQVVTTQHQGAYAYTVKWSQWEQWFLDDSNPARPLLCRALDTSPGGGECYELRDQPGGFGSAWIPQFMAVGTAFTRRPIRIWYDKATGREKRRDQVTDYIKLAAFYPEWTSPAGFKVRNVVRLEWYLDAALTQLGESYWYGDGYGLIGWAGHIGGQPARSAIEGEFKTPPIPQLTRERLAWWNPPPLPTAPPVIVNPPTPPITPPTPAGQIRTVRRDIIGANIRALPGPGGRVIVTLPPGASIQIVQTDVQPQGGDNIPWMKTNTGGYVRSDLIEGGYEEPPVNVTPRPLWPLPFSDAWLNVSHGEGGHKGWDLILRGQSVEGMTVFASGLGRVAFLYTCSKCTPDKPSALAHGFALYDSRVLNDAGWGYGYGNGVVVVHKYRDCPDDARAVMDRLNLKNGYLYITYGHLRTISVAPGDCVDDTTPLGEVGNTGNSDGFHLHMEPWASMLESEISVVGRQRLNPQNIFIPPGNNH